MPVDERYIPLNVKTYREGFLRLQGWTCVSLLAFVSGALLVLYEVRARAPADAQHAHRCGGGGGGEGVARCWSADQRTRRVHRACWWCAAHALQPGAAAACDDSWCHHELLMLLAAHDNQR